MINLELFQQAISLLTKFKETISSENKISHVVGEAITRIKSAQSQYSRIMKSNNALLNGNLDLIETKKFMNDDEVFKLLQDQSKNDPELAKFLQKTGGKLKRKQIAVGRAHDMNALDKKTDSQSEEIKMLHLSTEEFYDNLWNIILKLNQTTLFKNYKPKGVREVRNDLIIHNDKSGAYFHSFGYTNAGPVLRPIRPTGISAPADRGLDPNIKEFLTEIIKKLS